MIGLQMKTIKETEDIHILLNTDLFKKHVYALGASLQFELLGTGFVYSHALKAWSNKVTFQHTVFYYDFQEIFDLIMGNKAVSDDVKNRIIFHLPELSRIYIYRRPL